MISDQEREKRARKVTVVGSIGNAVLVVFKFICGFAGHSSAMIADAVHSLSDFASDLVVLVFLRLSAKPSDSSHDYGHGKYETLAAAIISLALFAVGLGILWAGGEKIWLFFHGTPIEAPGMIALWAALISIVLKEVLYRYTIKAADQIDSAALKANAWHHRSDALSSIGTAVGIGGAILLGQRWTILDPLAAVIVSLFIIKVSIDLIRPCIAELLEASLPADVEQRIIDAVMSVPDVSSPHNLRTRRIGNKVAVEMHVRMHPDMTVAQSHEITRAIEAAIRSVTGPQSFVSIHVEPLKQI